jgi:UDP-3-O-[3-hydroxymyristoyl] glucosamine N-acyltransferase
MYSLKEISNLVGGSIIGDPETVISSVNSIENAGKGCISYITEEKYLRYLDDSDVAAIIIPEKLHFKANGRNISFIIVENVYQALSKLLASIEKDSIENNGISELAFVSPDAILSDNVAVGAFSYISGLTKIGTGTRIATLVHIGKNCKIGKNVKIYPGVKIYNNVIVGDNCIVHANSVLGSDGFSFKPNDDGVMEKIPHIGNVILEDNVEIGSNTVIDRATFGSTIIRKGVKLDNLIQIAHNAEIGENTVIAAQSGIAGSTKLGKNVMVGGQVGFKDHLTIADGAMFQAQSGINQNIKEGGKLYQGAPAIDYMNHMKSSIIFKNLPQLQKRLSDLEKELEKLKKNMNEQKNH